MKTEKNGRRPLKRALLLLAVVGMIGLTWGMLGQTTEPAPPRTPVFTPAHSSVSEAFRHFFGIRPEPQQPIAYTHQVHVEKNEIACAFCHQGVERGPVASIPGVSTCMGCHEFTATDKPEVQKIIEYQKRNEEIPWQRVYGWPEESHVRFNHAPHIRAKVDCATCHGDVAKMTVAEKVVDHTMGFCVQCHEEKKASNDCMTCHY